MVLAALVTASCVIAAPPDESDPNGTLTTYLGTSPTTIDPQISNGSPQVAVVAMVFESLLAFDPKTLLPVPAAATDLPAISADGLTYGFTIREDARYSDGAPVRARDFAFAFTRLCDPALDSGASAFYAPIAHVIVGCKDWNTLDPETASAEALRGARARLITEGIRIIGEREIEFRLNEPARYFPSIVALWIASPVREADVTRGGERWAADPATFIGNGPFVLETWRPDDRAVFVPNPYYRDPPKIKKWTKLLGTVTSEEELAAFRDSEVDVFYTYPRLSAERRAALDADPEMRAQAVDVPGSCTYYVGFNSRKPPFDDRDVRMAFAKALDRVAHVRDVEGGMGTAATSFIPPGSPGHDAADVTQAFDPEAARALLAGSRHAGSAFLERISVAYPATSEPARRRSTWLRSQWKEHLAVDIRQEPLDPPAFGSRMRNIDTIPHVILLAWCSDYPDQQNWLTLVFHSSTQFSGVRNTAFTDAEFDRLTREADGEPDRARRDALYRQAQRILTSTAYFAPYYYEGRRAYLKPWVRGVIHGPLDVDIGVTQRFKGVYIAKKT